MDDVQITIWRELNDYTIGEAEQLIAGNIPTKTILDPIDPFHDLLTDERTACGQLLMGAEQRNVIKRRDTPSRKNCFAYDELRAWLLMTELRPEFFFSHFTVRRNLHERESLTVFELACWLTGQVPASAWRREEQIFSHQIRRSSRDNFIPQVAKKTA